MNGKSTNIFQQLILQSLQFIKKTFKVDGIEYDKLKKTPHLRRLDLTNIYDRLLTFEDWPRSSKPFPKELAEAGFFYTGKSDVVTCSFCKGSLFRWGEEDIPFEVHSKYYSNCKYLMKCANKQM